MGPAESSYSYPLIHRLGKIIMLYLASSFLISQIIYPQNIWLNFTASNEVKDVAFMNGFAWAATNGGLLRVDTQTHQIFLFNPSNSDIPSNNLSCLYADRKNILWIGTFGQGAVRFDGKEWKTFDEHMSGLKYDRVLSFGEDNSGILWIGTEMGVNRYYDGGVHSDWDIQGIIQDIKLDKSGILWITTTGGLERIKDCKIISFEGQTSKPVPFFNVRNLALGKDKDVWMLTDGGIVVYRDSSYSQYYGPVLHPNTFVVDSTGDLWLGLNKGIIRSHMGEPEAFEKDSNKPAGRVGRIRIDPDGRVWACSNKGLFVYDTSWSFINTATSIIASTQSVKIFSDSHKNIWMKNGSDLILYGRNTTVIITKALGAPPGSDSFAEDKNGNLWFGHYQGITSYNGKVWEGIDTISQLIKNRDVEIFETYKDTSWVNANYKSYLLDSAFYFDPIYSVSTLHFDKDNNLWLKADNYLFKFDHKNWMVYDQFNSGIPAEDISALTSDNKGHLWIGTFKHGLYEFDGDDFISCLSSGTFPDTSIIGLNIYNDTLIVRTDRQIQFLPDCDLSERNKMMFISPYVRNIFKDSKGNYWFGSNFGLFEFTSPEKRALYDIHNSGLSSNYVSSISEDFDGNLWILTSTGGVNIFNENSIVNEKRIKDIFTNKGMMNPTAGH